MCSMEFYTGTSTRTNTIQLQSHPGKQILMGRAEEASVQVFGHWFPSLMYYIYREGFLASISAQTVASSVIHSHLAVL